MLLLELATQAVKGFSPTSRSVLRTGYNVLVPAAGTEPGASALLAALLFHDGTGRDALLSAEAAVGRAAVTFQANDGRCYRLVRHLGGGGALQRQEQGNAWSVVSQDLSEIGQALKSLLALPSRAQFEEIFCVEPRSFPSRQRAETAFAAGPASTVTPTGSRAAGGLRPSALVEAALAATSQPRLDPATYQQLKTKLARELVLSQQAEQDQERLEAMHRRIDELEQRLRQLDAVAAQAESAQKALASGPPVEALCLPADGLEQAARYDDALKRHGDALAKAREETLDAQARLERARPESLIRDRGFLAGIGLGALALGLGIAFRGSPLGYLALLDIPAFGFAGLRALRAISESQAVELLRQRVAASREREEKLSASFDAEYFGLRAAMRVVGVETGRELLAYVRERARQEALLEEAQAKLEELKADSTLLDALDEQEQLKAEAARLEQELMAKTAGGVRPWREIERELQELEDAQHGPARSAPEIAPSPTLESVREEAAGKEDPTPRLLSLAQELFANTSLEALGALLAGRASQYLAALSDKRYTRLSIDGRGQATLTAADRVVPASQLEDRDRDLLYLSVKLTLIEKLAALRKLPVVLDEPFVGFDDAKLQLISRMLKHIASMTQVVHATALPAHISLADAATKM